MPEQGNELEAKNKVAAKPETKALPLNPDEEDSKGLKELATEKENKNGEKDEEAGKPKTALKSSEELKKMIQSKKMNSEPKVRKQRIWRQYLCLQSQMRRNQSI